MRLAITGVFIGILTACSAPPPDYDLPPLVYLCPMPKDSSVLEGEPGKCPACGMELKPVRIVQAYSCLNNTAFIQETPGKCVTDGTDMVPISASLFFACADDPTRQELTPGKCADGSDRIRRLEARPHGDHNPRHGGQFFMADDGWHHLEGVYPNDGLFRVYFYDDWSKPLAPEGFSARAIVKDASGAEAATVPLRAGAVPNALEAEIPNAELPFSASLRVSFEPEQPEKMFDFSFREHSVDPDAPVPAPTTTSAPAPAVPPPAPVATAPGPKPPDSPAPPVAETLQPAPAAVAMSTEAATPVLWWEQPVPATAKEILQELDAQSAQLAEQIQQEAPLGRLWLPALRTKDLAIALVSDHLTEIPENRRVVADNAASRLLRSAWAIDNFADLGDRDRVLSAHEAFALAVADLKRAYASLR